MPASTPDEFAALLARAAVAASSGAVKVVGKGANSIKTEARANVLRSAPTHNGGAWKAINYDDPAITAFKVESEIGYDRSNRLGRLGNLLEYGGGGDHSPPHRDLGRALDAEEPRFLSALSDMSGRLL